MGERVSRRFVRSDSLTTLKIECAECGEGLQAPAASLLGPALMKTFARMHKCPTRKPKENA